MSRSTGSSKATVGASMQRRSGGIGMHPMDKVSEADLAPFIADPRAARAMGALPLRPPTKSGKPFEGASRR